MEWATWWGRIVEQHNIFWRNSQTFFLLEFWMTLWELKERLQSSLNSLQNEKRCLGQSIKILHFQPMAMTMILNKQLLFQNYQWLAGQLMQMPSTWYVKTSTGSYSKNLTKICYKKAHALFILQKKRLLREKLYYINISQVPFAKVYSKNLAIFFA